MTSTTGEAAPTAERGAAEPAAAVHTVSASRRIAAFLITLAALGVVGVLVLELIFRVFVPVSDVSFHFWDPVVGARKIPHQVGRTIKKGQFDAPFHFNAQGWNHRDDYTLPLPRGTRRVALIGDSMVEALQVMPERHMTVLAAELMSRPGRAVQWYSFGRSGWGPNHAYEAIRHYALDYKPDVVLLMFVQNDPWDGSPYLAELEGYVPRYDLDDRGELQLRAPGYWEPSVWKTALMRNSDLVRYFAARGLGRRGGRNARRPIADAAVPTRAGMKAHEFADQSDLRQREEATWQLIGKLFEAMRDECRARGAVFGVVYRGHYKQLDAALRGETYEAPPKEQDPFCLSTRLDEMGNEFVQPIAERLDIPYLDLTDALQEMVVRTGQSHKFPKDNHYNETGHATAAAAMADWVETLMRTPETTATKVTESHGS